MNRMCLPGRVQVSRSCGAASTIFWWSGLLSETTVTVAFVTLARVGSAEQMSYRLGLSPFGLRERRTQGPQGTRRLVLRAGSAPVLTSILKLILLVGLWWTSARCSRAVGPTDGAAGLASIS